MSTETKLFISLFIKFNILIKIFILIRYFIKKKLNHSILT
jgi:hypothetical protein